MSEMHCTYPDCNCPFDHPGTEGWCARGLPTPPASHDAGEAVAWQYKLGGEWRECLADDLDVVRGADLEVRELVPVTEFATLTTEVARLTGELDAASARLHEVATLCATVEQERDRLTGELSDARNALDDGADEVANWGAYADEYFQQKHDLVGAVEKLRALAKGKSSITTADQLRAELEKETAHSKHLAGAVSRKIEELITAENQCSYYKGQYTRAEQVRKEACEANVKAQAAMLWLEADLERSRHECEGLREIANQYLNNMGFIETETKLYKDLTALSQPGNGE